MFFFLFLSFVYSITLPPAFLLNVYNNQKKNINTLRLVLETNFNNFTFKETLLYSSPSSYRILLEKGEDSILFIRKANSCVGITKSTRIDIDCNSIDYNFFYNVFLYSNNYLNYLNKLGVNFNANKTEIELEDNKIVKDPNIYLALLDETPIYIVGIDQNDINSSKQNTRKDKNQNLELINLIKYKNPQVWIDKITMLPIRYYLNIDNKNFEVLFKHYQMLDSGFNYPKLIEFYYKDMLVLSSKVIELETKIKINEKLLDVDDYKKRFSKIADLNNFSENKKHLLNFLMANR